MMTGLKCVRVKSIPGLIVLLCFSLACLSGCISSSDTPVGPTPSHTSPATPTPAGLPDLVISDLRLEITPEELCADPPQPYRIVVQVVNQGQADVPGFSITLEGQPTQHVPALPAGEHAEFWFYSQTLEITVEIDPLDRVAEENEANNRIVTRLALPSPLTACASTAVPESIFVEPYITLENHTASVLAVDFSPDGNLVASGSVDNTLRLWRVKPGNLLRTMRGHPFPVSAVKFSPNGAMLATGSTDGIIRIWNVSDARLLKELTGHAGRISGLSFSGDGRYLVSGADDFTVRIWRMSNFSLYQLIDEGMSAITGVKFSPDNLSIAWSEANGTVRIRTLAGSWKLVFNLDGLSAHSLDFHPAGDRLAAGFSNGSIHIIDIASGYSIQILKSHTQPVNCLAFTADGRWLVSGSKDGSARLWSAEEDGLQASPRQIFSGHSDAIRCISLSPDGKLLASGSEDETVRLWRLPTE